MLRVTLIAGAGILLLLSSYTLLLGLVLLALCALAVIMPKFVPFGHRTTWEGHKYLHQNLKYSIGRDGLRLQGKTIEIKLGWDLLVTWRIIGDWLILSASGGPQLFFPISEMKQYGVFEEVMELAKNHGKEFK